MADPDRYVARICWNSKSWVRPTGEAASAESDTYARRAGFAQEEWLFNFEWVLNGWKYGYLRPVEKSRAKLKGQRMDVQLYTISPDAEWFYVGYLKPCEVIGEEIAMAARREFKKRGWLRDMLAQVKHVGGDANEAGYFNIRYKPADAVLYDRMIPVGANDPTRKVRRYVLVPRSDELKTVEQQWTTRIGTTELRPTGKQVRETMPLARSISCTTSSKTSCSSCS